jgi:hypothetical protein
MDTARGINNMNLCQKILKTVVEYGEPITTYRIAKELDEEYNSVKYNIQKLEDHKTILAMEREGETNGTYYVPNKLFTEIDGIIEYLEPVIRTSLDTAEMNENNAKFNFKMLLSLIINDIVVNNGQKQNDLRETSGEKARRSSKRFG